MQSLLAALLATTATAGDREKPRRPSALPVAAVVVPDSHPWLLPSAAAAAAGLARSGPLPLLIAAANPSTAAGDTLLQRVHAQQGGKVLVLRPVGVTLLLPESIRPACEELRFEDDALEAALALAKRTWGKSREVLCAQSDDPSGAILAGALAARSSKPLLVLRRVDEDSLARIARELGTQRATVAAWPGRESRQEVTSSPVKVEVLDRLALQRRLVSMVRPGDLRTIVLARAPEPERQLGNTAWLAPYVALARRGVVELCRASGPTNAENRVAEVIDRLALRPRSVTILADYASIGTHLAKIQDAEQENTLYKVGTEPCAPRDLDQLGHLAVGRIPFSRLADASTLFAAGLLRQRSIHPAARVAMIANPGPEEMQLPLCETISRLTAEEYKNCGLLVDEYYRVPATDPQPRAAASRANLIIYQGHIENQELFPDPKRQAKAATADLAATPIQPLVLRGLPVVVLQTCQSARGLGFLQMIHDAGGVGLIGTATEVHSASGSALTKAMTNAWLYRQCTLGEALRDAQNYFACLVDLKTRRGHQEQFKTERAAVSFRLWGDPELPAITHTPQPVHIPVSATLGLPCGVVVTLPARRLPEVRSGGYSALMFPGSAAAGIVVRSGDDKPRKVVPLYYFRLPLPDQFPPLSDLASSTGPNDRLLFRVDPARRFLYVLWFPTRERAGQQWILQLSGEAHSQE